MKKLIYFSLLITGVLVSCNKDDAALPDNTVNFSASKLGFENSETSKSFMVRIDRAASREVKVAVQLTATAMDYGTDFTTIPAAENNIIQLSFAAGETAAEIKVNKVGSLFDGDESLSFTIASATSEVVVGATPQLALTFGAIISDGSRLRLEGGGGSSAPNSVFVDFSGNEATAVARASWQLGFSCNDPFDFAVILNNVTAGTAVVATGKTNLDGYVISAEDSTALAAQLAIGGGLGSFDRVDDLSGDLSKTVIKEGKVYVVSPGESQPWFKVMVTLKDLNTYTIKYARLTESSPRSLDVVKQGSYSFVYASLTTNKLVPFEPRTEKWDIVWGRSLYKTTMNDGTEVPYVYSDLVLLNVRAGVKALEVLASTRSYADYKLSDLTLSDLSSDYDVIGSKWRNGGSPNTPASVKRDRFYVVQDAAGNIYKLRFVTMSGEDGVGGERGRPEIEYALLK